MLKVNTHLIYVSIRERSVKYALAKIRKAARELLTLDEKDEKRLFQGK